MLHSSFFRPRVTRRSFTVRKTIKALAPFILTAALAGCQQQKSPSQKEQANREWNGARASVLVSLANEQYKSGNFDNCRRSVDEALKLTPDSEPLHLLSAKLAIEG